MTSPRVGDAMVWNGLLWVNGQISNDGLEEMPANTMKGNATSLAALPTDLTAAETRTNIAVTRGAALVVNTADASAYQTIQAALDAGAASGNSYVVEVYAGVYTENLTPSGAQSCVIKASIGLYSTYLDGTITWNPDGKNLEIDGVEVGGAVSGVATANGGDLICTAAAFDSTITFTGGDVGILANGKDVGGSQGYFEGAIAITGQFLSMCCKIAASITASALTFKNSRLHGTKVYTTSATSALISGCDVTSGVPSIVFSGSAGTVVADQYALAQLQAAGSTITNGIWGSRSILTRGLALTVATGVVTATHSRHTITGEGGAADDLVTISGTVDGQQLILSPSSDSVTITVKNGTGNIFLAGSDFAMDNLKDRLLLISDGTNLYEIGRGNNGA